MNRSPESQRLTLKDKLIVGGLSAAVIIGGYVTRNQWDGSKAKCSSIEFTTVSGGPDSTNVIAIPILKNSPKATTAVLGEIVKGNHTGEVLTPSTSFLEDLEFTMSFNTSNTSSNVIQSTIKASVKVNGQSTMLNCPETTVSLNRKTLTVSPRYTGSVILSNATK